jgi:hypothetical protein
MGRHFRRIVCYRYMSGYVLLRRQLCNKAMKVIKNHWFYLVFTTLHMNPHSYIYIYWYIYNILYIICVYVYTYIPAYTHVDVNACMFVCLFV